MTHAEVFEYFKNYWSRLAQKKIKPGYHIKLDDTGLKADQGLHVVRK